MKSKKKMLIINRKQFGYHTDSYKLAINLLSHYEVFYLSFDGGLKRISHEGVRVEYISYKGSRILSMIRFIVTSLQAVFKGRYDEVFLVYFPFSFLVPLLSGQKIILDIRTGSVSTNTYIRNIANVLLRVESFFFHRITVISDGLRQLLKLPEYKSYILPLGADNLSDRDKVFDFPRLFYIGIFNARQLDLTLEGLAIYINRHPDSTVRYDLVGFGSNSEEALLKNCVNRLGLQDYVIFHGRLSHEEARPFFDICNIGVSYVPKTVYFEHQPPTKTFEYVMAGMPVIATATAEHKYIVNDANGILCDDNPEAFSNALELCVASFPDYQSASIRQTLVDYSWENISNNFRRYLENGQ